MRKLQKITNTISRVLQKVEMFFGCIFMISMLALMLVNALARYVLDFPIIWSDELNNFFFIWLGFLSCAYIMGEDKHMRVTAIADLFPKKVQILLRILMDVLMIAVFVKFIPAFFTLMKKVTFSGLLRIPLKYIYAILPLSFSLMTMHVINNIVNKICYLMGYDESGKESV